MEKIIIDYPESAFRVIATADQRKGKYSLEPVRSQTA